MTLISFLLFFSSLGLRFLFDFNLLSAMRFKFGSCSTVIILSPSIACLNLDCMHEIRDPKCGIKVNGFNHAPAEKWICCITYEMIA